MEKINNERPAVYVGTYAKYNNGDLSGEWLYLDEYESKEEFIEACKELHKDEEDPELMFQDWDYIGIPLVTENFISPDIWDFDYCGLVEHYGLDAVDAFLSHDYSLGEFEDIYQGEFDSEKDFAECLAEEMGMLDVVPERLQYYFDYEAFARDLFACDYRFDNGYVFLTA